MILIPNCELPFDLFLLIFQYSVLCLEEQTVDIDLLALSQIDHLKVAFCSCSFEQHEAPGSRSFFTEIIASISDIKFSMDGRHILSRDYMTLKVSF